jgi:nucleotide-binding universal stress UspA family protein
MYYHPLALKADDIESENVASPERAGQISRLMIEPGRKLRPAAHRILVPLDGSRWADEAIDCLVNSASDMPALEVHILNVQPLDMRREFALDTEAAQIEQRERLAPAHEILERARTLLEASGIACKTATLFGHPAQAITRYARQHDIDAIVMGTRGMGALGGLLRGSVATKVVNLADVPVTLIKAVEPVSL